jgi:signal transduction histidine kinase
MIEHMAKRTGATSPGWRGSARPRDYAWSPWQDGSQDPGRGGDVEPEQYPEQHMPYRPGRRHWGHRWARARRGTGPLRRSREDRLAAGLAAGLAARTGLSVGAVRTAFVLGALVSGFGAAAYVLGWLLVPFAGADGNIAGKALNDRRGIALVAGLGSLLAVLLLIASVFGAGWLGSPAWSLFICLAGTVLIWRNGPADEQAVLRRMAGPLLDLTKGNSRLGTALRASAASLLLAGGLVTLLSAHANPALLRPLAGVALVIAAIVVVLGPWWLRIARDLAVERQARVRAEERAEVAARVHDSVLQTLALIQRRAGEPAQVIQLARAQERELRRWLFGGRVPGSVDEAGMTFTAGVRLIQHEVEAQHRVAVEAVTVGDCELDDNLSAMLAAAREATVNAAKWSGVGVVSLFAEVEPTAVSLFVRDRGRGFDPAAVPADRKGLSESVRARMARRGGSVTIRSAAGEGTEVALTMPRAGGEREPCQV